MKNEKNILKSRGYGFFQLGIIFSLLGFFIIGFFVIGYWWIGLIVFTIVIRYFSKIPFKVTFYDKHVIAEYIFKKRIIEYLDISQIIRCYSGPFTYPTITIKMKTNQKIGFDIGRGEELNKLIEICNLNAIKFIDKV